MKQCSKCKRELDETQFVKSDRYKDGLYPSCKECRKATFIASRDKDPMCRRCKVVPHEPSHVYCYDCHRIMRGQTADPKFRRDSSNKTMCCRCKSAPRLPSGNYCLECRKEMNREWQKNHPPMGERKRRATVRKYVYNRLKRGHIERQPCAHCGQPSVEFHHLDYEDRTQNVQQVCHECHVKLEREKIKPLDKPSATA